MGSPWRMLRGRTLAKIAAAVLGVLAIILALYFVPWSLTIEGRGSLLPEERRTIYAPISGIVVEIPVDHGDRVKKGDLIARLDSKELTKELKKLIAERDKARSQSSILQLQDEKSTGAQSEEMQYQVKSQLVEAKYTAKSADEQIEIIQEQ